MTGPNPELHTVAVVVETDEDGPRVSAVNFTCTAPADASCRTYPSCDCEIFTECDDPVLHAEDEHTETARHDYSGHPYRSHQECWVQGWFDNGGAIYAGPDAGGMRDDQVPAVVRTGHVAVSFMEDYVEWTWHETPETAPRADRHDADEWCALLGVQVLDPDGWDRTNLNTSWSEPITRDEFLERAARSTIQVLGDDPWNPTS